MMMSLADVFNECFEAWTAEELLKFTELLSPQETTSSDDNDREVPPSSPCMSTDLVESEEFLQYLEEKIRQEYPDEAAGLSREDVFQMGLMKRIEKEYCDDDLSKAMASEPRNQSRAISKAALWASKATFYLTEALLFGSIVGLAMLTVGSLMLSGAIISMATGIPVLFSTTFLISPLLVSFSPVITVLGTVLFLGAFSCLIFGSFCFCLFYLLCWIHDYLLGRDPPGARELAALPRRARALLANSLLRIRESAGSVAGCCQYIKESAIVFSIKVLLIAKRRKILMPTKKPEPSKTL